ncbi:MAG: DUF3786 domain-containing protein [Deltaproteobacteria bacterium]|nr:DUF3786 domain-containing protein [Deltaproteobacteria bacterium]
MFESEKPVAYEQVFEQLMADLGRIDLADRAAELGCRMAAAGLIIPFFNSEYLVNESGVTDLQGAVPAFTDRIVVCYYLLHYGRGETTGEWVSYRDFKDSAFFMSSFEKNVHQRTAEFFSGKLDLLRQCSAALGGETVTGMLNSDLCHRYQALPRVPLLLSFYDQDEDFPASLTVFFDRSGSEFLDMECLAVLGWILSDKLIQAAKP